MQRNKKSEERDNKIFSIHLHKMDKVGLETFIYNLISVVW